MNSFSLEMLMHLLESSPNGLLIYRDELSGIVESFKKKGHENSRQFLLEGWNGNGDFRHDVLSRETKPIYGVALTLLGGTQPSVLNKMFTEMKQDQNNDGFIQRFQLVAFPNQDIEQGFIDKPLDVSLDDKIKNLLETIIHLDPFRHGALDPRNTPHVTSLSPEAYILFSSYMDANEKEVSKQENGAYRSHLSKFGKLLSGLILILHVVDNLQKKEANTAVQVHIVKMAIKLCDLFKAHAKKLYDTEYSFQAISGFALAKKIVEGKVSDTDSIRKIYHNEWENLQTQTKVELAASFLEKYSWLKVSENKPHSGRSSTVLTFNPLLEDFLSGQWHE